MSRPLALASLLILLAAPALLAQEETETPATRDRSRATLAGRDEPQPEPTYQQVRDRSRAALADRDRPRPEPTYQQITVHLTDYTINSADEKLAEELATTKDLTAILRKLTDEEKVRQTSQISLRAMENVPAEVHFGEQVPIVQSTGGFGGGRGAATSYRYENVGTRVEVQWTKAKEQYALSISYQQSYPQPSLTEDTPVSTKTRSIQTTAGLKPGEIILINSRNQAGEIELLTLSVTSHEQ